MVDLGDALVQIADKLGITTQHIAEVYINAQRTVALINITILSIWLVVAIAICVMVHRYEIRHGNKGFGIFLAAVALIVLAFFMFILHDQLILLYAPEYSGIKEMMYDIARMVQ